MDKWTDYLKKISVLVSENKRRLEDRKRSYEQAIAAAQAFIEAHAKSAPKVSTALAESIKLEEDCRQTAAKLSDLEEDLEKAKHSDDEAEMKKIEGKMKPLIKTFENGRKEANKAVDEAETVDAIISKQWAALQAAVANLPP
jgi:hypothetical protein